MKRIKKLKRKRLYAFKIYLDELEEIVGIITEHCGALESIKTDKYSYNSIDELKEHEGETSHEITFKFGEDVFEKLTMVFHSSILLLPWDHDDTTDNARQGVVSRIEDIILSNKRPIIWLVAIFDIIPFSTVILSYRKDRPTFWKRNKDAIITGIIVGVACTLLGVLATLFVQKMMKPERPETAERKVTADVEKEATNGKNQE